MAQLAGPVGGAVKSAAAALGALFLLTSCATSVGGTGLKPGQIATLNGSGTSAEESLKGREPEFHPGLENVASERSSDLPADFPTGIVEVPENAQIFDAGSRSEYEWFLVLSLPDRASCVEHVLETAKSGGLTLSEIDKESVYELTNFRAFVRVTLLDEESGTGCLANYEIETVSG